MSADIVELLRDVLDALGPLRGYPQGADLMRRVESALAERAAVPEGWKLVPVEPTDAMLSAAAATPGIKAIDSASTMHQLRGNKIDSSVWGGRSPLQQAYAAMLAAAPQPTAERAAVPAKVVEAASALIDSAIDSDASGRPEGSLYRNAMALRAALTAQPAAAPLPAGEAPTSTPKPLTWLVANGDGFFVADPGSPGAFPVARIEA